MPSSNSKNLLTLFLIPLLFLSQLPEAKGANTGEQLYLANCAKCHGREGEGFLKLYPPILNSHYLKDNVSELPCIIRNGMRGEIIVDDVTFNQIMPAIQQLSPEQMTNLIGFMQQQWDHPKTDISVKTWLEKCNSQ